MQNQEIQRLEKTIKKSWSKISSTTFHYIMEGEFRNDEYDDDEATIIYERIKSLYLKIVYYLELRSLPHYREMFINDLGPLLINQKTAMKISNPLTSDSDPYLTSLGVIENYLSSIPNLSDFEEEDTRLGILEEVLDNSAKILHHTGTTIGNESDIYNQVKWFLEIIFPQIRSVNKARFIKKFKTYHPDILIPEIKAAIEYKLIRKGHNIDTYIDQVKTDADNYDLDYEYEQFFAVLYMLDKKGSTKKAIEASWKEKKFPANWNLIVIYH